MAPSTWVSPVRDRPVADRQHADCLVVVCELVDDAIPARAQRAEATQPPPERVSDVRIPFPQSERVLDSIDQRPIELEQSLSSAPRENDRGHASPGRSTLGEIAA
jgi:hypothetical protein